MFRSIFVKNTKKITASTISQLDWLAKFGGKFKDWKSADYRFIMNMNWTNDYVAGDNSGGIVDKLSTDCGRSMP